VDEGPVGKRRLPRLSGTDLSTSKSKDEKGVELEALDDDDDDDGDVALYDA
jgi:hypothetical protein